MVQIRDIPDVDIDVQDRTQILKELDHVVASIHREKKIVKHNSGVYFQDIPVDGVTGWASLDHEKAEELGYVKLDLLHNHVYTEIKDPEHLNRLVETEPNWDLLEIREVVEELFQIHDHFDLVKRVKPKTIEELAMTIALVRPGKRHLVDEPWERIRKEIWLKTDDVYSFKMSHSFAYAQVIMVQMNLIMEKLNETET